MFKKIFLICLLASFTFISGCNKELDKKVTKSPPLKTAFEIKGLTLGMSFPEARSLLNMGEHESMCSRETFECKGTIANIKPNVVHLLSAHDGPFMEELIAQFDEGAFESVFHALTDKFGSPHEIAESKVERTFTGREYNAITYKWYSEDGSVLALSNTVIDYSNRSSLAGTGLILTSDKYNKYIEKEARERPKGGGDI